MILADKLESLSVGEGCFHRFEAAEAARKGRLFLSGDGSAGVLLVNLQSLPDEVLEKFLTTFAEGRKAHANRATSQLAGLCAHIHSPKDRLLIVDFKCPQDEVNKLIVISFSRGFLNLPSANLVNGGPHWNVFFNRQWAEAVKAPKIKAFALEKLKPSHS
jgi:hypothetical protein